jgi:hypothetical protein
MRSLPHRATLLLIGALALADVAGATWLWMLWEARHGAAAGDPLGSKARSPGGAPDRQATLSEIQHARQAP